MRSVVGSGNLADTMRRGALLGLAYLCSCADAVVYDPYGASTLSGDANVGYTFSPHAVNVGSVGSLNVLGPDLDRLVQVDVGDSRCEPLHITATASGAFTVNCSLPPYNFDANATRSEGVVVGLRFSTDAGMETVTLAERLVYYSPGQLDHTFGTSGIVVLGDAGRLQVFHDAVLTSDGGLVAAAAVDNRTGCYTERVAVKLDRYGRVDATFGWNGAVLVPCGVQARAIALLGDTILLAGRNSGMWIGQVSAAGVLESEQVLTSGADDTLVRLAPTADGKLLAAGVLERSGSYGIGVLRLSEDGSVDMSFGEGFEAGLVFQTPDETSLNVAALMQTAAGSSLAFWWREEEGQASQQGYLLDDGDGRGWQSGSLAPAGTGHLYDATGFSSTLAVAVGQSDGLPFVGTYSTTQAAPDLMSSTTLPSANEGSAFGVALADAGGVQIVGGDVNGVVLLNRLDAYLNVNGAGSWSTQVDVTAQTDVCLRAVLVPSDTDFPARGVCVGVAGTDAYPSDSNASMGYFLAMRYWL